ncbi:MAG: hypothetical protein OXH02_13990 [Gemmatimonadetes bacterium]|nr:hypothetical protein [Gemmatimonadota bacterium]
MDLQTLIVAIVVGVAAAFVVRTFTRQFNSRDHKGCGICSHGGSGQLGMAGMAGQSRQSSASRDDELIQVEPIQVEESVRE